MTRRELRPTLLAVAASLTLAAGCGGGTPSPAGPPAGETTSTAGTPAGAGGPKTTPEPPSEQWRSPLDRFLSARDATPEEEDRRWRKREQLIVACMRDEGFEYAPQERSASEGLPGPYRLPEAEFTERYGYGITTLDVRAVIDRARREDPNAAIEDSLSPSALRAYAAALHGAAAAAEKYGGPVLAGAGPGCIAKAERVVFTDREKKPLPQQFDAILEEMNALSQRIERDPRLAAAEQAWSDCMADAGYPGFDHPDDARTEVTRRLWKLYGADLPENLDRPPGPRRPELELAIPGPPRTGVEPSPAELRRLKRYELAVAAADARCRPGYEQTYREVQEEIEQAFLDANRAELEGFREAAAAGGGG